MQDNDPNNPFREPVPDGVECISRVFISICYDDFQS